MGTPARVSLGFEARCARLSTAGAAGARTSTGGGLSPRTAGRRAGPPSAGAAPWGRRRPRVSGALDLAASRGSGGNAAHDLGERLAAAPASAGPRRGSGDVRRQQVGLLGLTTARGERLEDPVRDPLVVGHRRPTRPPWPRGRPGGQGAGGAELALDGAVADAARPRSASASPRPDRGEPVHHASSAGRGRGRGPRRCRPASSHRSSRAASRVVRGQAPGEAPAAARSSPGAASPVATGAARVS